MLADDVEALSRALLSRWTEGTSEESSRTGVNYRFSLMSAPDVLSTGVYGVGVAALDPGTEFPVLIANSEIIGEEGLTESTTGAEFLEKNFSVEVPDGMRSLGVSEPMPAASSQFVCSGRVATFGAAIHTRSDSIGCLTAGHAAGPIGQRVNQIGGRGRGIVTFTEDPSTAPPGKLCADVAVIDFIDDPYSGGFITRYKGTNQAFARDGLMIYRATGDTPAEVFGFCPWIAVPSMNGLWANVYLTTACVTEKGDSGAQVVLVSEDDLLVGHVVGGSPGMTTYIQDAELQLNVTGALLL